MSWVKDVIENPHPISRANKAYWDFLLNSYEGGVDYCNAFIQTKTASDIALKDSLFKVFVNGKELLQSITSGNLFKHPKERVDDYNERLRMSYYYNFCAPVIDIYTNHLFKQSIVDDFGNLERTAEEINENFDFKNGSIEEFRRDLSESVQIYGHSFVIVDSPNVPQEIILTRQDQIINRVFPYASIYPPQCVINWALDRFGNPYWVIIRETYDTNSNPETYDKTKLYVCNYKLWTRNEWYLYDDKYNLIDEGTHGLGVVPIVCVFDKKSRKQINFLGISSLADIAFIARDIYNSCSELKQILRDQTFAFLAVQGDASEYDEMSVGTSKALLYPEGRALPSYISPPSSNADTYFTHIDRQIRKIYQIAKLEGGSAAQEQSATQQTGVSKAWDFNETNTALSKKSLNLEDGETKIWQIIARWEGKEFDGRIDYPREFSVQNFMSDLDEAEKSSRIMLGDTFDLEIRKAIHKKRFPRMPEQELRKMAEEAKTKLGQNNNGGNGALGNRFKNIFNANSGGNGGF